MAILSLCGAPGKVSLADSHKMQERVKQFGNPHTEYIKQMGTERERRWRRVLHLTPGIGKVQENPSLQLDFV